MSGITPGPWSWTEQDGVKGHCELAQIWDVHGYNIADVSSSFGKEVADANAALIAAAPELLKSCELALRILDRDSSVWGATEKVRAAIAKATSAKE